MGKQRFMEWGAFKQRCHYVHTPCDSLLQYDRIRRWKWPRFYSEMWCCRRFLQRKCNMQPRHAFATDFHFRCLGEDSTHRCRFLYGITGWIYSPDSLRAPACMLRSKLKRRIWPVASPGICTIYSGFVQLGKYETAFLCFFKIGIIIDHGSFVNNIGVLKKCVNYMYDQILLLCLWAW